MKEGIETKGAHRSHKHEVSEGGIRALQSRVTEAMHRKSSIERAFALQAILDDCSEPLLAWQEGEDLSPEFAQLLESLWKLCRLEDENAKLDMLLAA